MKKDESALAHERNDETFARGSVQQIMINTFNAGAKFALQSDLVKGLVAACEAVQLIHSMDCAEGTTGPRCTCWVSNFKSALEAYRAETEKVK